MSFPSGIPLLLALEMPAAPTPPPISFGRVDLSSVLIVLFWLITTTGAAYATYLQTRKAGIDVAKKEADSWRGLAEAHEKMLEVRNDELSNIGRRVSDLENRVTDLRRENEEVRGLNVHLQLESTSLRDENRRLTLRVDELERFAPRAVELQAENAELVEQLRQMRLRLAKYENTPHE